MSGRQAKEPSVLFVVVSWNNQELLEQCFESIYAQTYKNYNVVLVDNASSDDTVKFTKQYYPDVEIIVNKKNLGFARANNIGISHSMTGKIDYVALINTDATLSVDWLENIINFAAKKPRVAGMQGTTLDYYNNQIIDSTHIYVSRNGSATQGNWRQYNMGELGPLKVFGVNAAAAVYSAQFIREQKNSLLFDESLFMYLEDVDVAIRSTLAGWDNYLVPGAKAYHMGSASSMKKSSNFSLYYTYRNNIAILIKSMPWSVIFKILPRAVKSDYLTIKHLIKTDRIKSVPTIFKGRFVGLLRTPIYILARVHRKKVKISVDYLWALMNEGK